MKRFAWIIVAAVFLLAAFALVWEFTHLEGPVYFAE
jgi:hypothetical protein